MDDVKVLTPEEQQIKDDVAAADKRRKEMCKMQEELKGLVEYRKKVSGNITSVVIDKMKRIGIKICYDLKDGVLLNKELDQMIKDGNTVCYIDGNICYYLPLEALQ